MGAAIVLIGFLVSLFYPFRLIPYFLGAVAGCAASTFLMMHRFSTLSVELDMEKRKAVGHLRFMATLRLIISLGVLMAAFIFPHILSPWSVFMGLFATKLSAIVYPFIFKEKNTEEKNLGKE